MVSRPYATADPIPEVTRREGMKALPFLALAVSLMTAGALAGCAAAPAPSPAAPAAHAHGHDPSSHNHDRGHMMIASNGVVDALLTSHLSAKDGNELDVFVEKNGNPLALTTTEIKAKAKAKDGEKTLTFACAPPDERPAGEPAGSCSHFVARATWMDPADRLQVVTSLPLKSGDVDYTWRSFDPRRYAHHVE
jgi:hypothetical protein